MRRWSLTHGYGGPFRSRAAGHRPRPLTGKFAVDSTRKAKYEWVGPFEVQELLAHCIDDSIPLPPESESAYLVSVHPWSREPSALCRPLYVGGNTGHSARFRTRLGDLVADSFGFFGGGTGHSSGGRSIHQWSRENQVNPLKLHVAWVKRCACHRCLEIELVGELSPVLNRKAPARCSVHG